MIDTSTTPSREGGAVVDRRRSAATGERAAVDPDHHRQRAVDGGSRDRQREAVLVLGLRRGDHISEGTFEGEHGLRADRPVFGRIAAAFPGDGRLRRSEPQVTDRRRRERNPLEVVDPVLLVALDLACSGAHDRHAANVTSAGIGLPGARLRACVGASSRCVVPSPRCRGRSARQPRGSTSARSAASARRRGRTRKCSTRAVHDIAHMTQDLLAGLVVGGAKR